MTLAVVDASALVAFYAADDPRRDAVTARLATGDAWYAPAHMDVEVTSALRGLARHNADLREMVPGALRHLSGFPIRRMPLAPLLERIWQLQDNVTPYDAAYIALAERLDGPLVTCDGTLSRASGPGCAVEVIASSR